MSYGPTLPGNRKSKANPRMAGERGNRWTDDKKRSFSMGADDGLYGDHDVGVEFVKLVTLKYNKMKANDPDFRRYCDNAEAFNAPLSHASFNSMGYASARAGEDREAARLKNIELEKKKAESSGNNTGGSH